MSRSLKVFVLASLVWSIVPQVLLAVEPNVSIDPKPKVESNPDQSTCVQVPDTYLTTGPFTARELEAESLREWDKNREKLEGSVPRVPFGKASAEWKAFLRQLQKGDQLLMYDEGCCSGIIIVRKGCIVDWFPITEA